jgi:hypothetical protein
MPKGISDLSPHILFSQFRGPFPVNLADDGAGGGDADGDKGEGDQSKGDDGDKKKGDKKKPDSSDTEGRITVLAREKQELQEKLAKIEADKKAEADKKLLEEGKLSQVLEGKTKELDTLTGEHTSLKEKLAKYEGYATKQIKDSIKAIGDKEKQKTAEAMLEGKAPEEQLALLPNILALVGAQATSFGGTAPASTKTPDKNELDVKKARHKELITKTTAGTITGSERGELHRLGFELSDEFRKEQEAKTTT